MHTRTPVAPKKQQTNSLMCLILSCLFSFLPRSARASDAQSDPKSLLRLARSSMAAFVPNTYLVYVDAKRTPLSNCANQPVWRFFFATNKDSYYRARPVAGYVEYAPKPVSSGDCERSERVVVDTALAPVMGYIPLAKHQNLDTVQVTWQEALNQVAAARPGFVWDGNMEIFTPVYPGLEDSVYYVYFGAINQRRTQVLVDATTGDVVP